MTTLPPQPSCIERVSNLLKVFDQVRQPLSSSDENQSSGDMRLCIAGEISTQEYLRRRIELSLLRLAPHLDAQELNYVRHACFEYLEDDFVHTVLFRNILSRLRKTNKSGHIQPGLSSEGGVLVNQNENTAPKLQDELGSQDLQALKRHEITVDEYLERRLEHQIRVLKLGRLLTEEEREKMRILIRENFLRNPLFHHYLNSITGSSADEST